MRIVKISTPAVEQKRERFRNIQAWVKAIGGLVFFGCFLAFVVVVIITPPS